VSADRHKEKVSALGECVGECDHQLQMRPVVNETGTFFVFLCVADQETYSRTRIISACHQNVHTYQTARAAE